MKKFQENNWTDRRTEGWTEGQTGPVLYDSSGYHQVSKKALKDSGYNNANLKYKKAIRKKE